MASAMSKKLATVTGHNAELDVVFDGQGDVSSSTFDRVHFAAIALHALVHLIHAAAICSGSILISIRTVSSHTWLLIGMAGWLWSLPTAILHAAGLLRLL